MTTSSLFDTIDSIDVDTANPVEGGGYFEAKKRFANRVIIAGSRGFNDYDTLKRHVDRIIGNWHPSCTCVVSGTAGGADRLGEDYAYNHKLFLVRMPAFWESEGPSAGYRRNARMAEFATHAIIFWDGKSRGSKHMFDLAVEKLGRSKVRLISV